MLSFRFRDASFGACTYNLTLLDCLHGLNKVSCEKLHSLVNGEPDKLCICLNDAFKWSENANT